MCYANISREYEPTTHFLSHCRISPINFDRLFPFCRNNSDLFCPIYFTIHFIILLPSFLRQYEHLIRIVTSCTIFPASKVGFAQLSVGEINILSHFFLNLVDKVVSVDLAKYNEPTRFHCCAINCPVYFFRICDFSVGCATFDSIFLLQNNGKVINIFLGALEGLSHISCFCRSTGLKNMSAHFPDDAQLFFHF